MRRAGMQGCVTEQANNLSQTRRDGITPSCSKPMCEGVFQHSPSAATPVRVRGRSWSLLAHTHLLAGATYAVRSIGRTILHTDANYSHRVCVSRLSRLKETRSDRPHQTCLSTPHSSQRRRQIRTHNPLKISSSSSTPRAFKPGWSYPEGPPFPGESTRRASRGAPC